MVFRASSRGLEAGADARVPWVGVGSRLMTGAGGPMLTGVVVAVDSGEASRLLSVVVELKAAV